MHTARRAIRSFPAVLLCAALAACGSDSTGTGPGVPPVDAGPQPFDPTSNTTLEGEQTFTSVNIPAGVTVTVTGDLMVSASEAVIIAGELAGDCIALDVSAAADVEITGIVGNACSSPPDGAAPTLTLTSDGSMRLAGARLRSSGDALVRTAPDIEASDFPGAAPVDGHDLVLDAASLRSEPERARAGAAAAQGADGADGAGWTLLSASDLTLDASSEIVAQAGGDGGAGEQEVESGEAMATGGAGGAGGGLFIGVAGTMRVGAAATSAVDVVAATRRAAGLRARRGLSLLESGFGGDGGDATGTGDVARVYGGPSGPGGGFTLDVGELDFGDGPAIRLGGPGEPGDALGDLLANARLRTFCGRGGFSAAWLGMADPLGLSGQERREESFDVVRIGGEPALRLRLEIGARLSPRTLDPTLGDENDICLSSGEFDVPFEWDAELEVGPGFEDFGARVGFSFAPVKGGNVEAMAPDALDGTSESPDGADAGDFWISPGLGTPRLRARIGDPVFDVALRGESGGASGDFGPAGDGATSCSGEEPGGDGGWGIQIRLSDLPEVGTMTSLPPSTLNGGAAGGGLPRGTPGGAGSIRTWGPDGTSTPAAGSAGPDAPSCDTEVTKEGTLRLSDTEGPVEPGAYRVPLDDDSELHFEIEGGVSQLLDPDALRLTVGFDLRIWLDESMVNGEPLQAPPHRIGFLGTASGAYLYAGFYDRNDLMLAGQAFTLPASGTEPVPVDMFPPQGTETIRLTHEMGKAVDLGSLRTTFRF